MFKEFLSVSRYISAHPLTRNNKLKSLSRVARWQIGSRLLGKRVIVPWVDQSKFIVGVGETGLTGNLYAGFMEYQDMLFLLHALRPDEIFVDVGANIGAYTILASKVVGSRSVSFEPLPDTVQKLREQVHLNGIDNLVSIRNTGVSDKKGSLFFTNDADTVNKVSLSGASQNTTSVEVVTLDQELKSSSNYFFKIDVEGFEFNVLNGGDNVLSSPNTRALIIELNGSGEDFGHSDDEIHRKITSFGFEPFEYDPMARRLTKLPSFNRNGGNTIYIKDVEEMSRRCKEAPTRKVHTAGGLLI
jgi:FkbM family methyltransferase